MPTSPTIWCRIRWCGRCARNAGGGAARGAAAGDAGRIELSRGRRHSGRADRNRDVAACPRTRPRESLAGGRTPGAAAGEMMASIMHVDVMNEFESRRFSYLSSLWAKRWLSDGKQIFKSRLDRDND